MISTGIKNDETLLKSKRFASYGFFSGVTDIRRDNLSLLLIITSTLFQIGMFDSQ